jgi:hypothetical protein
MEDFREAFNKVGPSITPEMEKFYESFAATFKKVEKPLTPSPIT